MKNRYLLLSAIMLSAQGYAAVDPKDSEFMKKAAIAGEFEIQSSKLAQKSGSSAPVISFADMMVTDHTATAAELKTLAKAKGVSLPKGLDQDHADKLSKLKTKKPGPEFDEAYADLMEDGHDSAVSLFESAAESASDPQVKAFAQKTLPTLKMHSEHAEKLDMKDISP